MVPYQRDDSMLTFEGAQFKGVNDIIGKLTVYILHIFYLLYF
jgi:hypothetical protein